MKLGLSAVLVLSVQIVLAQGWKVSSGESDFDGKYITAVLRGTGGAYPYNSPGLIINRFGEDDINFYVTDFGYGGCDNNKITLLFDRNKAYTANFTVNDENDIFFFSSFNKDEEIFLREQIFNEILSSKRLAVRIENSCYSRDFVFDLNGASSALDRVVGIKNVKASINAIKLLADWEPKVDSLFAFINYPSNAVNELTIDKLGRLKFFIQVPYKKFYKMSREDAILMVDISLSYLQDNNYYDVVNQRGQLVVPSIDTGWTRTGYYFNIKGDSLSLKLNNEQILKEDFLVDNLPWIGYPGANLLRRLDIVSFDEYKQNFIPDIIYRIGLSVENSLSSKYYIEPSEKTSTTGILYYKLPGIQEKLILKEFPLLYESMEMKRIKEEARRRKEDSIQDWLNTPDTTLGTFAWDKVELKPKISDCQVKSPADCMNDLITKTLRSNLREDLSKFTKPFWVLLKVDYQGQIVVENVSGLPNKKTILVTGALSELPILQPPRNAGKVCDVSLELMVSLN
jgi:hypothetical protein